MRQDPDGPVHVVGAGIAGSWQALLLARAGREVILHEREPPGEASGASHAAGGMLAPDCEGADCEPVTVRLGARSLELWREHGSEACFAGSLIIAHPRDRAELERLARRTTGFERVGAERISALEPALAGRFRDGLFFPREGHVEPRRVLPRLHAELAARGVALRFGADADPDALGGIVIDCRGLAARADAPALRAVKGEQVLIETEEIALSRPVRLLHPRWPLYLVPRRDNRIFIGATSIESEDSGVSVRSALELLTAAYAVHPAFGEARIVELGAGLRPAFPDNLPRIEIRGRRIAVNGLYRHGFLIAPALAELTAGYLQRGAIDNEVMRCC